VNQDDVLVISQVEWTVQLLNYSNKYLLLFLQYVLVE